jgi:Family of unknown function (DUF5343)
MVTTTEKSVSPAYTSYRPLVQWLNGFRDTGHVPQRVDKSHLGKASGSVVAGHLAALRFLKLTDDGGKPTPLFEKFVMAQDDKRAEVLGPMVLDSYAFLFNDPEFDLARASSKMLEDKFRALDIKGSTLMRAISFFLSVAKAAGTKMAPDLKAPAAPPRTTERKSNGNGKRAADAEADEDDGGDDPPGDKDDPAVLRFEIPIPVNRKVKLSIPADFDEADWTLLQTMFNAYVTRWRAMSPAAAANKEG